ncbi:MAG: biotin transporter BioY, partial [Phycisphaerae bacterium]
MRSVSNVTTSALAVTTGGRAIVTQAAWVFAFAVLLAISAQVSFPLPFTPVPVTMQTLVVVLAGVALGPWLGVAAVATYLGAGIVGLPVFAGASA